jgi:hypothetical protein
MAELSITSKSFFEAIRIEAQGSSTPWVKLTADDEAGAVKEALGFGANTMMGHQILGTTFNGVRLKSEPCFYSSALLGFDRIYTREEAKDALRTTVNEMLTTSLRAGTTTLNPGTVPDAKHPETVRELARIDHAIDGNVATMAAVLRDLDRYEESAVFVMPPRDQILSHRQLPEVNHDTGAGKKVFNKQGEQIWPLPQTPPAAQEGPSRIPSGARGVEGPVHSGRP